MSNVSFVLAICLLAVGVNLYLGTTVGLILSVLSVFIWLVEREQG